MDRLSFSLKQLFVSMFLMSAGMAAISYAFRSLYPDSVECAAAKVLGAVAIILGALLLVTKQRRMRALILVLCGILAGFMVGGIISAIAIPGLGRRYLSSDERRLADIIGYASAAVGAIVGFIIAIRSAARSDKPSATEPTTK